MVRSGVVRSCLAGLVLAGGAVGAVGWAGWAVPAGATTSAGAPACTFNGSSLPLLIGAKAGEKVALSCSGLSPLQPYLVMETSLLLGIDPKAAPLLSGGITSLAGLMALLAALPEINPQALAFPVSDESGKLQYSYTLPTSQAPDPNATCPPSTAEINDGLIGCGLAMIDLSTFKTVGAGSALIEYTGDPLFPPNPTMALSAKKAASGQKVAVSEPPGATTHWWLATLAALGALLGAGGGPAPTVTVTVATSRTSATAPNDIKITPAVYNNSVLTPPEISGGFTVPPKVKGKGTVAVTYRATLLGSGLTNVATAPLTVH